MLDKKVIKSNDIELDEDRCGLSFYSIRKDKVATKIFSSKIIRKYVPNKNQIPIIILFDHLVYNKDRHPVSLITLKILS